VVRQAEPEGPVLQVRVFADMESMSEAASAHAAGALLKAARGRSAVSLVLSGGTTPGRMLELLATLDLPWGSIHVFFSDERMVPPDDERSNFGLARRTFLSRVPIPKENVHPMPTHSNSEDAARSYENEVRRFLDGQIQRRFDLVFLGMGRDGHTASLFPGRPNLMEHGRFVVSEPDPGLEPRVARLTMTLTALNRSREVVFLISGGEKLKLLERISSHPRESRGDIPAAMVLPRDGAITWFVSEG
jgi:6-phosphogluconolactonase